MQALVVLRLECMFWLHNAGINVFVVSFTVLPWVSNQLCYLPCREGFFRNGRRCFARPSVHLHLLFFSLAKDLVWKCDSVETRDAEVLACHHRLRCCQRYEEGWGLWVAPTGWFRYERGFESRGAVWIWSVVWLRVRHRTRFWIRGDDWQGNLQRQPVSTSTGGRGAGLRTQLPA